MADKERRFLDKSWARAVESFDDVPNVFKQYFIEIMKESGTLPYAVYLPPTKILKSKTNAKMICIADSRLHVMEKSKRDVDSVSFNIADINYLEVGTILLHSWVKFSGLSGGSLTSAKAEFNTVMERLFKPVISAVRAYAGERTSDEQELNKFEYLKQLNFKFMNYARDSIVSGEKVILTLYQPKIRSEIFHIFNFRLFRLVSVPHVFILTDREIIIIRDNDKFSRHDNYGGIWTYIPLSKFKGIELAADEEKNILTFSLMMTSGDSKNIIYELEKKQEVESLAAKLNSLAIQPV